MKESGLSHELCYAVSDHPTEGFSFGGTLVSIADLGYKGNQRPTNYTGNTHGGIACNLGGQIPMVKSDTARRKDKKKRLPYFTQSGEDREKDGDQYIANLKDGGWAGFKYFAFEGTERKICLEVRGNGTGNIRIYCRKKEGPAAERWTSGHLRYSKGSPEIISMDDMILGVLIICILHQIWTIRFFVARMLPEIKRNQFK